MGLLDQQFEDHMIINVCYPTKKRDIIVKDFGLFYNVEFEILRTD